MGDRCQDDDDGRVNDDEGQVMRMTVGMCGDDGMMMMIGRWVCIGYGIVMRR